MTISGEVGSQRAPKDNGKVVSYGPFYNRTVSMRELKVNPSVTEMISLYINEEVSEGGFKFSLYEEKGCILPCKGYGSRFRATLLEKVRLEDDLRRVKDEFYPAVKRLMDMHRNWGVEFTFRGLSAFIDTLMEWTEHILDNYGQRLKDIGIYGLVGASQFPYNYNKEVWRAFCEHWSSLTNTLHHGGGEVGISLNDLKQISGLPILGDPYEEYLPPNEQLLDGTSSPFTAVELLKIHAKLCQTEGTQEVSWYKWIRHFYRGEQTIVAYGEAYPSSRKKKPLPASNVKVIQKKLIPLDVSKEGELAAFLALLLSRFIFPGKSKSVRPETFMMASFMAQGKKISLAPAVLGHIYHGLGEVATYPGNPGSAKPSFGIHFVIGWLAEYFPSLYPCRPANEIRRGYPPLVKYAGVNGHPLTLYHARLLFRGTEHVSYRAVRFGAGISGRDYVDSSGLLDSHLEHLLCIRSAVLPVRVGTTLILEPYYPNRFARQFGFDQGVPANDLNFCFSQRSKRSLEDVAKAYARLFRTNTGTRFHIPLDYHQGTYTYSYCGWWARVSAPYLAQSCHKVKTILLGKNCLEREKEPIFVITDSRTVTAGIRGAVKVPQCDASHSGSLPSIESSPQPYIRDPAGKKANTNKRGVSQVESLLQRGSPSDDVNPKRARYSRPEKSNSSPSIGFHDLPIPDASVADVPVVGEVALTSTLATDHKSTAIVKLSESSYSGTRQEGLDIQPIQSIPVTLQALLSQLEDDWVRQSISIGVNSIVQSISDHSGSPHELLIERPCIMRRLETLGVMATVNNVNLNWFILKIQNLFDDVEVATNLAGVVDTRRVEELSAQLTQQSSMLALKQA